MHKLSARFNAQQVTVICTHVPVMRNFYVNRYTSRLLCKILIKMAASLKGKTALVTGAGKGIGRAITKRLGGLCDKVFAISRTQADLDSLKAEVPNSRIETRLLDIADWDETRKVVEDIPSVDFLVNNAGISPVIPFLDTRLEELDKIHEINFRAAFNITQIIAKGMVARGNGGSIVNISSGIGLRPFRYFSAYAASKAALEMLTKCLALELAPHKIRANTICPGCTDTSNTQAADPALIEQIVNDTMLLGRIGEVDDIVNATVFLLSDNSSMITGTSLPVDGGFMIHHG